MTRAILLATATGFVAIAGAQAAELPTKAKPVQYVKICTTYGDGYYYIPGTNTCIKIGGYIREDIGWNTTGARTPNYKGAGGAQDRTSLELSTRGRANFAMDVRSQTQYGVVRSVASMHFQNQDQAESMNTARAFIQWAGWTFGRFKSYQDTYAIGDSWNIEQGQTNSDTGADGVQSIAYTWDVGGGVTLDAGVDDRRTKPLINLSSATALKISSEGTDSHETQVWPDFYGALHIDETWGFVAFSAGVHNVNASYYTGSGVAGGPFAGFVSCPVAQASTSLCGHPADRHGFFAQLGGEYKLPMMGGDRIGVGVRYSQGASGFGGGSNLGSPALFSSGNNAAIGWMSDGVFVNGSGIELTTAASVQGGYEHYWVPNLSTDIFAGYAMITYDAQAKSYFAGALCGGAGTGATAQTQFSVVKGVNSCNPNWAYLEVGSKTTWRPFPDLTISGQVMYNQVWSGFSGPGTILALSTNSPARPTGAYVFGNQGIWTAYFRIQRNYSSAVE
jgi:Porin subfamily